MKFETNVPDFLSLAGDQGTSRHKYFWPLAQLILKRTQSPKVLEVGSWAGQSLVAWDRAFLGRAKFTVVDTWAPYGVMDEPMRSAAVSGDIVGLFWHNTAACGMEDRIEVHCGDSRNVLPVLIGIDQFDLIYLDGDHRYNCVTEDIRNARKLIVEGGILCGDDLDLQLHEVADLEQHKAALASDRDFIAGVQGNGYHPGLTQAVAEAFGHVSNFDGLWAMYKVHSLSRLVMGKEWTGLRLAEMLR